MYKEILQKGHPIYNKPTEITALNIETFKIMDKMNDIIKQIPKIAGLAANQIGFCKRIIAINYQEKIFMINPEIIQEEGLQISKEGCGSIDGIWCEVERPQKIKAKYIDINNNIIEREFIDIQAWLVCHEIDHLDSIWMTDKAIRIHKE